MFWNFISALIGVFVWGSLLLASDLAWAWLSPEWYGAFKRDMHVAIASGRPFEADNSILLIVVLRSAAYSIVSGFVTAAVARETEDSTIILSFLLVFYGLIIHSYFWNLMPFWYHAGILCMLAPLAMIGGRLVTITPRRPKLVS